MRWHVAINRLVDKALRYSRVTSRTAPVETLFNLRVAIKDIVKCLATNPKVVGKLILCQEFRKLLHLVFLVSVKRDQNRPPLSFTCHLAIPYAKSAISAGRGVLGMDDPRSCARDGLRLPAAVPPPRPILRLLLPDIPSILYQLV